MTRPASPTVETEDPQSFDDAVMDALSDTGDDDESSDAPGDDDEELEDDESAGEAADDGAGEDDDDDSPEGDGEDDDEEDEDDEEPEETPAERRAREAEEQLARIRQEREAEQQEAAAVERATAVVTGLKELKTRADAYDEANGQAVGTSWTALSHHLKEGYKDHVIAQQAQQLRSVAERDAITRDQAEENRAFSHFYNEIDRRLKLNPVEAAYLGRASTPPEFEAAVNLILDHRGDRTKPAREAQAKRRDERRKSGADRTGVRGSGSARKAKATDEHENYTDLDGILDEALALTG